NGRGGGAPGATGNNTAPAASMPGAAAGGGFFMTGVPHGTAVPSASHWTPTSGGADTSHPATFKPSMPGASALPNMSDMMQASAGMLRAALAAHNAATLPPVSIPRPSPSIARPATTAAPQAHHHHASGSNLHAGVDATLPGLLSSSRPMLNAFSAARAAVGGGNVAADATPLFLSHLQAVDAAAAAAAVHASAVGRPQSAILGGRATLVHAPASFITPTLSGTPHDATTSGSAQSHTPSSGGMNLSANASTSALPSARHTSHGITVSTLSAVTAAAAAAAADSGSTFLTAVPVSEASSSPTSHNRLVWRRAGSNSTDSEGGPQSAGSAGATTAAPHTAHVAGSARAGVVTGMQPPASSGGAAASIPGGAGTTTFAPAALPASGALSSVGPDAAASHGHVPARYPMTSGNGQLLARTQLNLTTAQAAMATLQEEVARARISDDTPPPASSARVSASGAPGITSHATASSAAAHSVRPVAGSSPATPRGEEPVGVGQLLPPSQPARPASGASARSQVTAMSGTTAGVPVTTTMGVAVGSDSVDRLHTHSDAAGGAVPGSEGMGMPPSGVGGAHASSSGALLDAASLEAQKKSQQRERELQARLRLKQFVATDTFDGRATVDFYGFGKVLGTGSFGEVRLAWHRLAGVKVAIKSYEKSRITDPSQWKRVQQEIDVLQRLNHVNVLRMFETIDTPKRIHIVTENCAGGNLCTYVKSKGKLVEQEARTIFQQLLAAIEYLHSQGIVHRDIKLENVLFSDEKHDVLKLVDFG
ncbi:MAG: hypothetical protein EOO41_01705, partial [Methanobacteriota archaeon]